MDDRKDVTVPMPGWMVTEIEDELGYGDSRAGWIREAARQRLAREGKMPAEAEDAEGNSTGGMATGTN